MCLLFLWKRHPAASVVTPAHPDCPDTARGDALLLTPSARRPRRPPPPSVLASPVLLSDQPSIRARAPSGSTPLPERSEGSERLGLCSRFIVKAAPRSRGSAASGGWSCCWWSGSARCRSQQPSQRRRRSSHSCSSSRSPSQGSPGSGGPAWRPVRSPAPAFAELLAFLWKM